jgi:AAA15 family ATPase/GTPase
MGDGINRILYIVLSMVNAQNGYLLIDEFENGLHYSVQKKIWSIIFSLAERLNVQVFVTTHSSDCIKAFGSQWEGNKDKATMHRIDYKNKKHSVMPYDLSDLDDALSTNTEVR